MRVPEPLPLRQLRIRAKLTLDQLAYIVGVDASTLSRAERGYRSMSADAYERAVDACNCALAEAPFGSRASRPHP